MAITQTIATLPAVLNDSATFYEDIAERNNSLVTTVLPSINAWALQANTTQTEINAKAEQVAAQAVDGGYSQDYINSNFVGVNNAQNITAIKTFTVSPIIPNATTATQTMAYGQGVNLTTAQTIAGVKTFSVSPIVPTPTTGTQAVNKDYADLKVALAQFTGTNQSLLTNGYQKLPGGLIIQWGSTSGTTDGNGNFQITYPITFPATQLTCVFSLGGKIIPEAGSSLALSNNISVFGKSSMNINVTNYQNLNAAGANIRINWLVIGY